MKTPTLKKDNNNNEEYSFFNLNNQLNIPKDDTIQIDKDKEAVKQYFLEYVNPHTMFFHNVEEKIDYLLENDYLDEKVINQYERVFIKELMKQVYNKKFRFNTFMGAYKFYSQYAMKTNDKKWILERYEDRIVFNALVLGMGDKTLAKKLAEEMINQRYQPATPSFLNAGKKRRGEFVSCFLLTVQDSMNSIGRVINSSLQLSKIGGGVGINLSNIRANNDPIKEIKGLSDGVIPVMKLLEDSFSYANQMGQRNGSGVAYLNVFHPDIIDFLSVRKENADEKTRIKTLSLGLTVPDKYYELVKNNSYMYLFSPHDVEKEYGEPFSHIDITKEYDNLVNNSKIRKSKIKARDLETEISNLQNESGFPYIINIDTANRENPIEGRILMSNLCVEIFQVMEESEINDDQTYEKIGSDVSCNLGSTNVTNLMASKNLGESVKLMHRALTNVSDMSNIEVVPSVKKGNDRYHSVGLGVMNLHGYLAKNKIYYGSPEALEFVDTFYMLLNYWTLKASNEIAKDRQESFYNFSNSEYADGTYFKKYLKKIHNYEKGKYKFDFSKIAHLFDGIFIPSLNDWEELNQSIQDFGLYNAYRLATPPTGSISYVNEATASIHPIITKIEERLEGKRGKVYYPAPYLSSETIPYYESAYDIDQRKIIDTYATAQKHVDQGLSMTLFTRSQFAEGMYEWKVGSEYPTEKTTRDLNILRNYAWSQGIKSVYYVRTYTEDGEATDVNECVNCSI